MMRSLLSHRAVAALSVLALATSCSSGGGSPGPSPTSTPTPTPTSSATAIPIGGGGGGGGGATSGAAFNCPSSDTVSAVASRAGADSSRRRIQRRSGRQAPASTGLVAVTYASAPSAAAKTFAVSRERIAGGNLVNEMTFGHTGKYLRIVRVKPGTENSAIATLRAQPGVVSATMTGTRRSGQTVAQNYFPNDPYYNGFTAAQIAAASASLSGNAPTYHVGPYEESANIPGQWGMHAVRLDYAQAYAQSGNGSGIVNAGALGSSNVRIAVIDSGQDTTHPELASKVAYQKCFVTDGNGTQSTSNFSVDQDGHGTDVSGIAVAAENNGIGFTGAGGNVMLYAYRVFPAPDDTCVVGGDSPHYQCDASTLDIASAINDAVARGANVISLSLGGGTCTSGADPDSAEGNAIANAIAANVVVVAASGNDNPDTSGVSAPGCDPGVIAAGASALADGVATGTTGAPAGSSSAPVEYVAGYSQYGTPGASAGSAGAWGIVAPGGDPSDADASSSSTDDLHWIENIWTTTPLDDNFAGSCGPDFGSTVSANDCRILIAGTSMSTPLVAGAAALIISANATYQSPAKMKQLLCSTAHDIGDAHEGCGRLDIYRAMATAVGDVNLPASQ